MSRGIESITIKGFRSFREVRDFKLRDLNVIIGANGSGKSNFIQIFHMLSAMVNQGFAEYVRLRGGADNFLFNGPKETQKIEMTFDFLSFRGGQNSYSVKFIPTDDSEFLLSEFKRYGSSRWWNYGPSSAESRLPEQRYEMSEAFPEYHGVGYYVYDAIANWMVYHFHDTSSQLP